MKPYYPLNQSPLYKLQSRRKLAKLLELSIAEVEELANAGKQNYSFFDKETKPGKFRHIEWPKKKLKRVQRSLTRLLGRIEPPVFLHSAYRGRSYISNASAHAYELPSGKIDIRSFFPSADSRRVWRAFWDQFVCSADVAAVLTKLTTLFGHIPTGGHSSTMISFWAYKPMFDEIEQLARSEDIVMTCCVDDMTFTGAKVCGRFLNSVRVIIRRYGLRTHKERHFPANQPKVVTGVAITSGGARLPNARRQKVHDGVVALLNATDPYEKLRLAESLKGRSIEAAQVEPRFGSEVFLATKLLAEARKGVPRWYLKARAQGRLRGFRANRISSVVPIRVPAS